MHTKFVGGRQKKVGYRPRAALLQPMILVQRGEIEHHGRQKLISDESGVVTSQ